jgi:hypothetical protein
MPTVNLANLGLFSPKQAVLLSDLVAVNKYLMPHIVAGATGCQLEEAMSLLISLYDRSLADGFILVYHSKHQDYYFEKWPLQKGLPSIHGFFCQVCEEDIIDASELLYDFEFVINKDIDFEV